MPEKIRMISICGNFCIERRFVHFCRFRHRAHVCQQYNLPQSQTNESVVLLQEFSVCSNQHFNSVLVQLISITLVLMQFLFSSHSQKWNIFCFVWFKLLRC